MITAKEAKENTKIAKSQREKSFVASVLINIYKEIETESKCGSDNCIVCFNPDDMIRNKKNQNDIISNLKENGFFARINFDMGDEDGQVEPHFAVHIYWSDKE